MTSTIATKLEDNFERPMLTKVSGVSNYQILKTIKDEIKSNAARTPPRHCIAAS